MSRVFRKESLGLLVLTLETLKLNAEAFRNQLNSFTSHQHFQGTKYSAGFGKRRLILEAGKTADLLWRTFLVGLLAQKEDKQQGKCSVLSTCLPVSAGCAQDGQCSTRPGMPQAKSVWGLRN